MTSGHTFFRSGEVSRWREAWLQRHRNPASAPRRARRPISIVDVADGRTAGCAAMGRAGAVGNRVPDPGVAAAMVSHRCAAVQRLPAFRYCKRPVTGRPLMFFPLCLRRKWGLRIVEFADLGVCDYNAPIMAPDMAVSAEAMTGLWTEICRRLPPADIVRFTKMPELSFRRPVPLVQLDWMRGMDLRSWTVPLPKTRDEYDKTILKPKDRKEQRRKRRQSDRSAGRRDLPHRFDRNRATRDFRGVDAAAAEQVQGLPAMGYSR